MPTKRENHTDELTAAQKEELLTGSAWGSTFESEKDQAAAWRKHERTLLEFWTGDPVAWCAVNEETFNHTAPQGLFHRPHYWWIAGDYRRPRIRGGARPYDESGERMFGCPTDYSDSELDRSSHAEIEFIGTHPFFESERDYLLRHPRLLLPVEREALEV